VAIAPNSSVFHNVPTMWQPQSWACWYTSFQMVVAYERSRRRGAGLQDPLEVSWVKAIYDANKGIGATYDERGKVAKALGFQVLFASMSAEGISDILRLVPIIYAGRWPGRSYGHFVVLIGISESNLVINNPSTGMEFCGYNWFAGQMLLQTEARPLISTTITTPAHSLALSGGSHPSVTGSRPALSEIGRSNRMTVGKSRFT
jgi:hypothetical protein